MVKTSLQQKLGLFLFGILFTFVLLEVLLRLGGWFFLNLQEQANRHSLAQSKQYKILCLGESTTAIGGQDAYPRQLENILNARQKTIRFTVINKGVPATTTDQILSRVPKYLQDYRPDMVVAMIGVNDPPDSMRPSLWDHLSGMSRAVKLIRMIGEHLRARSDEVEESRVLKSLQDIEVKIDQRPSISEYGKLAGLYRGANHPEEEFRVVQKALALNPEDSSANFLLGLYWDRQAEYHKSFAAYQKALSRAAQLPEQVAILTKMAESATLFGDYKLAAESYYQIYKIFPRHPDVRWCLGETYYSQKNYPLAKLFFEEQLKIDPRSSEAVRGLIHVYEATGKAELADDLKRRQPATSPKDMKAAGSNLRTAQNYQKLYQTLRKERIPLVAVQYPLRSIELVKQMLPGSEGVIFVSNEASFKEALKHAPEAHYFFDHFAGDFGHCTAAGNQLLADTVASAILDHLKLSEK